MNDASHAQIKAAAPDISTWLSANAGSGKTRVLTDRVARLLLSGVAPERILCLTYTKAAAMEMQNRLFARLGEWAMLDDPALQAALADVGETGLSPDLLAQARTLFARAIEAPGGLKIQTIHSFCASVLRRFPLEAGVAPGFQEIDDRAQRRLIADLLHAMAEDPATAPTIDAVAAALSDDDGLMQMALAVAGKSAALAEPMGWEEITAFLGLSPDTTEDSIRALAIAPGDHALIDRVWPHLDPEKRNEAKTHRTLRDLNWDAPGLTALADLEDVLLTGEKTKSPFTAKIGSFGNATIRAALGDDLAPLEALMQRLENTRPIRIAFITAQRTHALHRFAAAFLPVYRVAKQTRAWLDFDDLIRRTKDLLSVKDVAQWVLFRLDGGIDHILVDEAQDTSPDQWEIVKKLAEDFSAGEGARTDVERTIFVVGDKKQSIYSFQGAEPRGFDRMRDYFAKRLAEIEAPFQDSALLYSFRSAPPILELVDQVAENAGHGGLGGDTDHRAFFKDKPGRVDLWPVFEPSEKPPELAWDDPQDLIRDDHHTVRLARAIARRIRDMIARGAPVTVGRTSRAVTAGDILILVRRRSPLFKAIISALKEADLPVAGVDRTQIAEPLAVKDLMSLMRFLATPEDDLSLAETLKSPLIGWDEAALFDLAYRRGKASLLRALRDHRADVSGPLSMLEDLLRNVDILRPYDLLERVLVRHGGRRNLIARLGPEAEDGIDALLAQALAYERMEVPSLTGFIGWMEAGDVVVKRDLAQPSGEIRVMTVHGAKGLEAPVVIVPDTGPLRPRQPSPRLAQLDDGPVFWLGKQADTPDMIRPALEAEAAKAAEEAERLLYVAMTRAECWLIAAAAGDLGKNPAAHWYGQIETALRACRATPLPMPDDGTTGLRFETGDWTPKPAVDPTPGVEVMVPDWATREVPPYTRDKAARSPSDLGGAKALPGEGSADDEAARLRRGRLVHLLLEHLPQVPEPAWAAAAPGICALEAADVGEAERDDVFEEAVRVLTNPALKPIFAPETLAEVEITGHSTTLNQPMFGVIDRLIVTGDTVTAVDFKTNRQVPEAAEAVPEGLLRQMGAYAEMLTAIYPSHRIETAILWSATAKFMPLPHDLVMAALARATTS